MRDENTIKSTRAKSFTIKCSDQGFSKNKIYKARQEINKTKYKYIEVDKV